MECRGDRRCVKMYFTERVVLKTCFLPGRAAIVIHGEKSISDEVGIAPLSRNVFIGEPSAKYNGTALIR